MTTHAPTGTVPPVDSAANVTGLDVVGNKNDTVAGTSLVSRIKQAIAAIGVVDAAVGVVDTAVGAVAAAVAIIDGFHDVPAGDSAANAQIRDVVGNKTDTVAGNSLYAIAHTLNDHEHTAQWVLPNLAAPVTATAGVGAYVYGAASASLGTPAANFDIHWVEVYANANDDYQAQILVNGVGVAEFSFRRVAAAERSRSKRVQMPVTAPGPITIRLASAAGGNTADFKVEGHNY